MSDKKILVGDMSRETAIGILKLMLEAMEVYDSIAPTPQRKNAVQMAIASLETDEAYQLEYEQPEFCEDCVSRKNILESLNGAFASTDWNKALFRKIVMDSPSVLPKATKNDLGVDAVSRKAINEYIDYILSHGMGKKKSFDFIKKFVANLPSVTELKIGHWTEEFVDTEGEVRFTCSCCGKYQLFGTDFCYHCGAKMVEQESEDKEQKE